jgi:DNA primase
LDILDGELNDYLALYNTGVSIHSIKPLKNQTYRILRLSNTDIRVIDRDKNYSNLTTLKKIRHFTKDSNGNSNKYFYMIPLQTPKGTIVGFILRSVLGKSYAQTPCFLPYSQKISHMYGFYKEFQKYDSHKTCKPLVICEGLKDCILVKRIYPYVLSNNTSTLGLNAQVLRNLSNKFLLVYDNDDTGRDSSKSDKALLMSMGCSVDTLKIDDGFKDCSDYIEEPRMLNAFKNRLIKKINGLENGVYVGN